VRGTTKECLLMLRVLGDGGSAVICGKVKDGPNRCARDN
jgi:hypothetical protein